MVRIAVLLLLVSPPAFAQDALDAARKAYAANEWSQAIELAKPVAEAGSAEAQALLGAIYSGWSTTDNKQSEIGLAWYLKAAAQEHVESQRAAADLLLKLNRPKEAIEWLRRIDDPGSMRRIAECYRDGTGVAQDAKQAAAWYRKAADKGDVEAMRTLGVWYRDGRGVPRDFVQAERWLMAAYAKGDATAEQRLLTLPPRSTAATEYEEGKRLLESGDVAAAVKLLKSAASNRSRDAQLALARLYLEAQQVEYDSTEVINHSRAAALGGRVDDAVRIFERCLALNRTDAAAGVLLRLAGAGDRFTPLFDDLCDKANAGDAKAMSVLALMYDTAAASMQASNSPDFKSTAALKLLYNWAAEDLPEATTDRGLYHCFLAGWGTPEDPEMAGRVLERAAKSGKHWWAELEWGIALIRGLSGATRNPQEGFRFVERAAASGEHLAVAVLAQCYLAGWGVSKDPRKAHELAKRSADAGFAPAVQLLGYMTVSGIGTAKDRDAGWALIARAARMGNETSVQNIKQRAEQGVVEAVYWWGVLLVDSDRDKGIALIRRAAEEKYAPAVEWLAKNTK